MKLLIALSLVILSGCAHATIHDYCVDHADGYSNYNECYQEVSQNKANASTLSKFGAGFQKGYQNAGRNRALSCTSRTDNGLVRTDCQ